MVTRRDSLGMAAKEYTNKMTSMQIKTSSNTTDSLRSDGYSTNTRQSEPGASEHIKSTEVTVIAEVD